MRRVTKYAPGDPDAKGIPVGGPGRKGRVKCPACGTIEPSAFLLLINHGFDDHPKTSKWASWVKWGICPSQIRELHDLGWWERGVGPRRHLVEPGHVLTEDEEDEVHLAFRRARYAGNWHYTDATEDMDPAVVAEAVAEEMTDILIDRLLMRRPDGMEMFEFVDLVRERTKARVESHVRKVMTQYEEQGTAFGMGESLDRALAALVRINDVDSQCELEEAPV